MTRALTVISCSTNVNIEDDIRCDDLCLQVQAPYSGRELYKAVWCFHNLFAYDSKHKTYDDKIHLSVIVIHRSGDAEECLNNIRQRERERDNSDKSIFLILFHPITPISQLISITSFVNQHCHRLHLLSQNVNINQFPWKVIYYP